MIFIFDRESNPEFLISLNLPCVLHVVKVIRQLLIYNMSGQGILFLAIVIFFFNLQITTSFLLY